MGHGYRLVRIEDGALMQEWGGVYGESPGIPNPLLLPNGDQVCGAELNHDYGGYRLEIWEVKPGISQVKQEEIRRVLTALGVETLEELVLKQIEGVDAQTVQKVKKIREQATKLAEKEVPDDFAEDARWQDGEKK